MSVVSNRRQVQPCCYTAPPTALWFKRALPSARNPGSNTVSDLNFNIDRGIGEQTAAYLFRRITGPQEKANTYYTELLINYKPDHGHTGPTINPSRYSTEEKVF